MAITKQQLDELINTLKPSIEKEREGKMVSDVLEQVSKKMDDLLNKQAEKFSAKESTPSYEYDPESFDDNDPNAHIYKMLYTPAVDDKQKAAQKENDSMIIASAVMKKAPTSLNLYRRFREGKTELAKAMANVAGVGSEWRPEIFSSDFIERMEMEYKVANLIPKIQISNQAGTLKVPAAGTAAQIYLISGASSEDDIDKIQATTPGTRVITIDPIKLGARVVLDADLQEDAVIDMSEYIKGELTMAAARAEDDICINGDTASTHQDTDVTSSADHRKGWDGFRKLTPSSAKVDSSDTLNIANFRKTWTKMSTSTAEYGNAEDCVILVNNLVLARLMTMAEVVTIDKYGTMATIVRGELARLFNIPVVPTSLVRRNLNASAVYDGTTTTYTEMLIVNKNAFLMGTKRQAKVESDRDITRDRSRFVITLREKMVPKYESTEPIVAFLYGLSVNT